MNKLYGFLVNALKVLMFGILGVLFVGGVMVIRTANGDDFLNNFFVIEVLTLIFGSLLIFSNMRHKYKIWLLIFCAFCLRLWWILSVNTLPMSDFGTMFGAAGDIVNGNFDVLKGYNYLARFPHLIPMTFYMACIIKIFSGNALFVMKVLNVLFGVLSVYLLYKLSDNFIESERNKLFILLVGAIFPAFITYTSVLCTENIAIPLYIMTLILFFKSKNDRRYFWITGMFLAFSNLFRGVAAVFLIAFLIYLFLCTTEAKYSNMLKLVTGYLVVTVFISGVLLSMDVIERPLWKGAEPSYATLLLKGSNFESNGTWNLEDAEFVEKHLKDENLAELCIEKVTERLFSKSPGEIFIFYAGKFFSQWVVGDCSGTYWAYIGADLNVNGVVPFGFQVIYSAVLLLATIGICCRGNNSLLCIILFGFILLFTIIETQARYSYVITFAFIILAVQGVEMVMKFVGKCKNSNWKVKKIFR